MERSVESDGVAVGRWVSVSLSRWSGGQWLSCHQARHAHQVVRRRDEVTSQLGPSQSAVPRSTEATDRFQPAEYLLNPFPHTLTGGVARMASGAPHRWRCVDHWCSA